MQLRHIFSEVSYSPCQAIRSVHLLPFHHTSFYEISIPRRQWRDVIHDQWRIRTQNSQNIYVWNALNPMSINHWKWRRIIYYYFNLQLLYFPLLYSPKSQLIDQLFKYPHVKDASRTKRHFSGSPWLLLSPKIIEKILGIITWKAKRWNIVVVLWEQGGEGAEVVALKSPNVWQCPGRTWLYMSLWRLDFHF